METSDLFRSGLMMLALLSLVGCSRQTSPSTASVSTPEQNQEKAVVAATPMRFRDATASSGVNAVYRNGEEAGELSIVESLGGGVGTFDFDRDGRLDLMFPGGGMLEPERPLRGLPNSLWRNVGDLRFVDRSKAAGIHAAPHYTHGCAAADFDGDGFGDFLVTGYGGLQLFRNQGDGTFRDCTAAAGLSDTSWSSSAGWGDFNADGHPDLYVVHYVDWSWDNHPVCASSDPDVPDICAPSDFKALADLIYFNRGDGTFRPAGAEAGLREGGKGLGVIITDVNQDAAVDIYVANDTTDNFLYINDGNGKFRDTGLISGTAVDGRGTANGSMGLAVFDLDQDLRQDLWITNYENETFALYRNTGQGNFLWATEQSGVNAIGTLFVGFGTVAGDFDRDGDEDLAVANGHVMLHPAHSSVAQEPLLLVNTTRHIGDDRPPGRLIRQTFPPDSYFARQHRGRGVVTGDFDDDGQLDLVFSHTNEPAAVLSGATETDGELLNVDLVGTTSNRDAIGARVVATSDRGSRVRTVVGGGSYLSQNPYTLTWGLAPGESVERLEVVWPGGQRQVVRELSPGQTHHRIVEP